MLRFLPRALAAFALAFAPVAHAQQAAPAPAAAPVVDAKPALWVVRDKDTTIYLFGTVHVLKPNIHWFDGRIRQAFDASDQVMFELPEPDPATMQALIVKLAYNPTGPGVTEQLPEDKRAAYAAALASVGVPAGGFDRFDAWLSAITISIGSLPKYGYDPESGAEKVLAAAAKAANKPSAGFETAEQQLGYLSGLPDDVQLKMLIQTLDELPKTAETMDKMVSVWAQGDPDALAKVINADLDSPTIAKVLLYDRNQRWADWIAERLKTPGTVFVAVGAGHLAGDRSVQADLAKLHVKAKRVKY